MECNGFKISFKLNRTNYVIDAYLADDDVIIKKNNNDNDSNKYNNSNNNDITSTANVLRPNLIQEIFHEFSPEA